MQTLITNSRSEKDIALLIDIAEKIGIELKLVSKVSPAKKEVVAKQELTPKQKNWISRLKKSVTEAKEVANGTRKGQTLQSFLDEL